ncbi:MAG: acyltransferase family protein [Mucilaginibacter sp.]
MPVIREVKLAYDSGTKITRITALDSLRGVAALIVVISHTSGGIVGNSFISLSPFYLLFAAHESVLFFFLLSGYVLVYQYEVKRKFNYIQFMINRMCRLYIPYFFALILAYILFTQCLKISANPIWLSSIWHTPISKRLFIDHIILVSDFDTMAINPVIWSLVVEMRITLIFPVLLFIIRRSPGKALITSIFVSVAFFIWGSYFESSKGFNSSYSDTMYYLYVFAVGGVIAKHQRGALTLISKISPAARGTLLIIMLFMLNYAHTIERVQVSSVFLNDIFTIVRDVFIVIPSAYLIIWGIYINDIESFIKKKAILYLGKISFSLYLVHIPISAFLYFMFFGHVQGSLKPLVIVFIISSLIAAAIFHYLIEAPAQRLAKVMKSRYFIDRTTAI